MDDTFNELVSKIVADYFCYCNCEPLNLSIVITDNIWKTYLEVRPDHRSKLPKKLPSFNGTIVAPLELDGAFTVIVDKQYFLSEVENN